MKKVNTKNLKPWPPGVSGNPGGMTKIDAALKKNKNLTKQAIKKIGEALLMGDTKEIEKIQKTGNALEKWLAGIILDGILTCDVKTLDTLLPWFVGKLKDELDLNLPKPTIISFGPNRIELGSKLDNEGEE